MADPLPYRRCLRPRGGHEAGFTLLEMLVAVTLLALIASLLTGALRFGVRVWETGERGDQEARVAAVQRLLFQWIQETEQVPMPGGGESLRSVFEGDARTLRFVGIQAGIGLPGGYYLNELYLDDEDGAGALSLRRRLVQAGSRLIEVAPEAGSGRGQALLEGVSAIEIAYLGEEAVGSGYEWLGGWADRLDLPLMVRIRIQFAEGDGRNWPDLIVPLATAGG